MPSATFCLEPKAPFSFEHSLAFLRAFQADGVAKFVGDKALRLPLLALGTPVLAELEPLGTLATPQLEVRLTSREVLDEPHLEAVRERLRFFLSLDDDLTTFYKDARRDDAFWPLAEGLYGYHQVKFPSVFAAACWALVTQRTPNRDA